MASCLILLLPVPQSSEYSTRKQVISRTYESSLGNTYTTLERRRISLFSRSNTFVDELFQASDVLMVIYSICRQRNAQVLQEAVDNNIRMVPKTSFGYMPGHMFPGNDLRARWGKERPGSTYSGHDTEFNTETQYKAS